MADYQPNSFRSKEEQKATEKKVEKIVKGNVKTRKKTGARKFADVFIAEDISNVKSYILMDVLVPAIKKAISDIVTNGIDMILYPGGTGRSNKSSSASKISYRNYYDKRDEDRRTHENRTRHVYSYDDIVLEHRSEAEDVLARMDELIETYDVVSVADLYDLIGKTCNYTDNKYGWTNIRTAEVVHVRDGYLLKLPKALPIK